MRSETEKQADGYAYQKTLLYIYPYLGRMAEATGRGADVKAALSYLRADTERAAEEILTEIARREMLCKVKRELREILKGFSAQENCLLEYKFFRRKKKLLEYAAGPLPEVSERTVYRRQNEILKKFSAVLIHRGLDERWFRENILPLDWAAAVYKKVAAGKELHVTGKYSRAPIERWNQGRSSLVKPNSSAGEDCGCACRGRRR